jgi:opacity protein-like surface antigen
MKTLIAATAALLLTTPLFAQERGATDPGGYVTGLGGFSVGLGDKSGNTLIEGGVRVAPHVMVFGNLGHFTNLQGDLQPTLDATASTLATTDGLDVTTSGRVPATYGTVGVRVELPMGTHVMPYLLGGIGEAHLKPTARLAYAGGIMPDGSTPDIGTDVTASIASAGAFTTPATSHAMTATFGGGLQIPIAAHWAIDAGYRYTRIAADSNLGSSPLNTNGMAFGFGYRF